MRIGKSFVYEHTFLQEVCCVDKRSVKSCGGWNPIGGDLRVLLFVASFQLVVIFRTGMTSSERTSPK